VEGDEFLDRIVTGDKAWVQFVNAGSKEQSKQWMHIHSPNKPKKFKQTLSNKKIMATVFWDHKTSDSSHATGLCMSYNWPAAKEPTISMDGGVRI